MKAENWSDSISESQNGNITSLAYYFNIFHKRLFVFACNLLADEQAAKDIVQDAFVKLWGKQKDLAGVNNIQAYLSIAVRNACFDYLKVQKKTTQALKEISYLSDERISEEEMSHATIEAHVIELAIAEIEKLPKQCRTIIQLILFDKLSTADIAKRLGITPRTVLNQKARAIALLRMRLLARKLTILYVFLMSRSL